MEYCGNCGYPVSVPDFCTDPQQQKMRYASTSMFHYTHHSCHDEEGDDRAAAWIEEWALELGIDIRDLI